MTNFIEHLLDICQEQAGSRIDDAGGIEALGVSNTEAVFPGLCSFSISQGGSPEDHLANVRESTKFSMWQLYNEVVIAYAMDLEWITAIGCRGVAERALRIVFQERTGHPADSRWSLGPLIKHSESEGVSEEILSIARRIKMEGDNLAHAKYESAEHWTGIEMRINPKEPKGPPIAHYKTGDAKACLLSTRDLLALAFGPKPNEPVQRIAEEACSR